MELPHEVYGEGDEWLHANGRVTYSDYYLYSAQQRYYDSQTGAAEPAGDDEAAQAPDMVYNIIRPMRMVSKGDLWLSSTPFGRRGFFYEEWDSQENMVRFSVPASECPRLDPDLLAREKRRMTDAYYRQEFQCEFVDPDDALFPMHLLNRAMADDEWLDSL